MFVEFKKMWFENFLSYGAKRTTVDFQKGLTLICGKNGAGKSSLILDTLSYCLYGQPYRKVKLEQLLNRKNRKGLLVGCEFQINKDTYIIERKMKPDSISVTKNGTELESLSSKRLLQTELDKIIGIDYRLFKHLISLAVSNNKPFLTLALDEKRSIIESIFNLNIFGEMSKILKVQMSQLKVEIQVLENSVKMQEENLVKDRVNIKEMKKSIEFFDTKKKLDLEQTAKELLSNSEKLVDLSKEIESYLSQTETVKTKLAADIKDSELLIEKLRKELVDNRKRVEEEIQSLRSESCNKIAELQNRIKELYKEFDKDRELLDGLYESKKVKIRAEIKDEEEKIKPFKDIISKKENTLKEQKIVEKTIADIEAKISICQEDLDFYHKNDVCPKCKQSVANKDICIKEIEDKEAALKVLLNVELDNISVIQTKLDEIDKSENRVKNSEQMIDKLTSKLNEFDASLLVELTKLKEKTNDEVTRLNNEVFRLEHSTKINDLENELKRLSKDTPEIIQVESRLGSLKSKLDNYQIEISSLVKSKEESKKIIETNLIHLKDRENSLIESKHTIDLETAQNVFDKACEKFKSDYKYQQSCLENIENMKVSLEILSDKGAKSYFFKKLMPILNQKVNEYLFKFDLPIRIEFDEYMQEVISDLSGRDQDINYYSFSAGERTRIDMSILFSFIDVNRMINNFNTNILLIDELLDSNIDSDGLNSFLEHLRSMMDERKTGSTYVVSHKVESYDVFDRVIKVDKESNFSKLEYVK